MRGPAAAFVILTASAIAPAEAVTRQVPAEPGALAAALAEARSGDVLLLAPGVHAGPVGISVSVTLDGQGHATLRGTGRGTVVLLRAPDIVLRGLRIEGSGGSHAELDAGVKAVKGADGARIENCDITGNLVGVDVHGAHDVVVRDNDITGRRDRRMNDRGNGVYVWNAPGTVVENNRIRYGRDGIFVNTSRGNMFRNNTFRDLRFAVHYMYAHDSEVSGNLSERNHLGYAVMFSRNVRILGNVSRGDRDHGIMLNYTNRSEVRGNRVHSGQVRCMFVYNAHRNRIEDNRFENCPVGIHYTAGSADNAITGNAFLHNRTQVKYVGSRWLEWSEAGRGNHWSDHAAPDMDGDGIADAAYHPNGMIDRILWTQPAAKLLVGAPAVQLLRWAQSAFPYLLPGGIVDRFPLTRPPGPAPAPS